VVDIHDFGVTHEGVPFVVMELLRGESLEAIIDSAERCRQATPASSCCRCWLAFLRLMSKASSTATSTGQCVGHASPPRQSAVENCRLWYRARSASGCGQSGQETWWLAHPCTWRPSKLPERHVDFRTDVYQATALLFAMLAGTDPFAAHPRARS
jgi:hypothetical protein